MSASATSVSQRPYLAAAARHMPNEAHTGSAPGVALATWHALAWLVVANAIGVLLALLLVVPRVNSLLGPLTYGRWMPVHMNLQLYGWCSLPLVAFLIRLYGADSGTTARWCRPVIWLWSAALAVGSASWLAGHSSGKLFLDWSGFARVFFPSALVALWLLLSASFLTHRQEPESLLRRATKVFGLALLLAVPALIYIASSPGVYPPINPDTGGPTGASQLEATLVIISILLLLPYGLTAKIAGSRQIGRTCWAVFALESLLCLGLGRADVSHHRPVQYISLASLLIWIPLIPAYYADFVWHENTRRWRIAFLCWWSVLVPTGWCLFLPGVLDHFKFTDGLVAHSLLAMAGFVSSLLIFAMVQMLGEGGWILNRSWSFYVWQGSVAAYVLVMFVAGWHEGYDPAFTVAPGIARNTIYWVRLLLGVMMLIASVEWLAAGSQLLRASGQSLAEDNA